MAVVGPFRALLASHFQASWNRLAKEMSRAGALAVVIGAGSLFVFLLLPLLGGCALGGYALGSRLEHPLAAAGLGLILSGLALGGGIASGILGGTRQLAWEAFRAYPVRLRTLFLAELLAGAGDLMPLVCCLALLALMTGLTAARPALAPLTLLVLAGSVLTLLVAQLLVGSLASALVKRLRVALTLALIGAWMLGTLQAPRSHPRRGRVASTAAPADPARAQALIEAGARMVAWLPQGAAAEGLAEAARGRTGAGLLFQLYPIALLLMAGTLSARLLAREAEPGALEDRSGRAARTWRIPSPEAGVARLHWTAVMGSHLGKFGFAMPLLTVVLIKGPFSGMGLRSAWTVPTAFAYLSMAGANFQFNQFGLDGHGVKALLLLPLSSETLLKGKALGMAAYLGLQALILTVLLALVHRPSPSDLAASLLVYAGLFLIQNAVGQWTSAWMPRPLPRSGMRSNTMPMAMILVSLATTFGSLLLFGGAYGLLLWFAPAWLLPGLALLLGLVALAHRLLLPHAAAYLQSRTEVLVERLA